MAIQLENGEGQKRASQMEKEITFHDVITKLCTKIEKRNSFKSKRNERRVRTKNET